MKSLACGCLAVQKVFFKKAVRWAVGQNATGCCGQVSAAAWSCGQALLVHMSMRRAGLSIARIRHGFRLGCFVTAVVGCSGGSGGPAACICSAGIKSDTPSPQRASGRRQRRRTLGAGWVALVLMRNYEPQGMQWPGPSGAAAGLVSVSTTCRNSFLGATGVFFAFGWGLPPR